MSRELLAAAGVVGLVALFLTVTVVAALVVGARSDREQPSMPDSPASVLDDDLLLTEADLARVDAWLAEQARDGTR